MLEAAGDIHDGGKNQGGGIAIFTAGVLAYPVEDLLAPGQYSVPAGRWRACRRPTSLEQSIRRRSRPEQLLVDLIDVLPDGGPGCVREG